MQIEYGPFSKQDPKGRNVETETQEMYEHQGGKTLAVHDFGKVRFFVAGQFAEFFLIFHQSQFYQPLYGIYNSGRYFSLYFWVFQLWHSFIIIYFLTDVKLYKKI